MDESANRQAYRVRLYFANYSVSYGHRSHGRTSMMDMAKIVSFNSNAPALRTHAAPVSPDDEFSISVRVEYVRPTGPKEFKACEAIASSTGHQQVFSRRFTDKLAFLTWLWDTVGIERLAAFEMFDQMVREGVVRVPNRMDEAVLLHYGLVPRT